MSVFEVHMRAVLFAGGLACALTASGGYSAFAMSKAAPKQQMTDEVLSKPTKLGFSALQTSSPVFQTEESWIAFIEILKSSTIKEATSSLSDWQALHEMNQEAEAIWDELLECNSHNAETARANYASGSLCQLPTDRSILKQRVIAFHLNFENFLRTTQFLIPKPLHRARGANNGIDHILYQFYSQLRGQSGDYDENDSSVIFWKNLAQVKRPVFHPFLSQCLIEHLSTINRIWTSPRESPYHIPGDYRYENVLIDYQFSSITVLRTAELAYWDELGKKGLLDRPETYDTARTFSNSWYLYSIIAKDSCEHLGLWPELSFAALLVMGGENTITSREVARAVNSVKCENRPHLKPEWRNAPAKLNDRDIILAQRRLGIMYGYQGFQKHHCFHFLNSFGTIPNVIRCKTVDPSAPSDITDSRDAAREHFSNPNAARIRAVLNFFNTSEGW